MGITWVKIGVTSDDVMEETELVQFWLSFYSISIIVKAFDQFIMIKGIFT